MSLFLEDFLTRAPSRIARVSAYLLFRIFHMVCERIVVRTFRIFSSGNLKELLDIGDFGRHVDCCSGH
jgi:hypothetical protein